MEQRRQMWMLESQYFECPLRDKGGLFLTAEAASRYVLGKFILPSIRKLQNGDKTYTLVPGSALSQEYSGLDRNPDHASMVQNILDFAAQEKVVKAVAQYNVLTRTSRLYMPVFYIESVRVWDDNP